MELIVVVVIVGILATFAMPAFINSREKALDKEAAANLKLIQAAQKIYRMETRNYIDCPNASDINTNLRLDIPTGSPKWNYLTRGPLTASPGCAQAARVGGNNRTWYLIMNDLDGEPNSGVCP